MEILVFVPVWKDTNLPAPVTPNSVYWNYAVASQDLCKWMRKNRLQEDSVEIRAAFLSRNGELRLEGPLQPRPELPEWCGGCNLSEPQWEMVA